MNDLIDRQAAIDAILHNQEVYSNNFGDDPIDKYTIAIIDNDAQTIAQLPSAQPYTDKEVQKMQDMEQAQIEKAFDLGREDAQSEIIACGDCKHWDTTWQNDYAPNYHYCPLIDGTRNSEWYCADAERREE